MRVGMLDNGDTTTDSYAVARLQTPLVFALGVPFLASGHQEIQPSGMKPRAMDKEMTLQAASLQLLIGLYFAVTPHATGIAGDSGGIDILVNNAAIAHPRKLEDITETEWDEVLAVNLKSVFLVTQAVVGGMRQRKWGRIINLSSVAAQTGGAVGAHYAASKAGIIGLTHFCASALVRERITVKRHRACVDRD